ncbi:hypothetical protein L1987_87170 [Smallanthus sonchifolius]|nr:hypothetical protein L1987_87170 [Smallanthus sonchifolius]
MAEESSKKAAVSLNRLHSRFLAASNSKSTAHGFLSEMKNPERQHQYDDPSPPKILENITNEENYLSREQGEDCASLDKPEINGLDHSSSGTHLSSSV